MIQIVDKKEPFDFPNAIFVQLQRNCLNTCFNILADFLAIPGESGIRLILDILIQQGNWKRNCALSLEQDETTILTSAFSGPKEKSLLKITGYTSGHLQRYFSGLKVDLASFHMVKAADLSLFVNFVKLRERTHKQKDLLVLPGNAGASL